MSWKPPKSPYGLIQEKYHKNEYKLLVSGILLNQTSRIQVDLILKDFFRRYPTVKKLSGANYAELRTMIQTLGFHNQRTRTLIQFAKEFRKIKWTEPIELHGIGKYGNDAWKIFCRGDWRDVKPTDVKLILYKEFLNGYYGGAIDASRN